MGHTEQCGRAGKEDFGVRGHPESARWERADLAERGWSTRLTSDLMSKRRPLGEAGEWEGCQPLRCDKTADG